MHARKKNLYDFLPKQICLPSACAFTLLQVTLRCIFDTRSWLNTIESSVKRNNARWHSKCSKTIARLVDDSQQAYGNGALCLAMVVVGVQERGCVQNTEKQLFTILCVCIELNKGFYEVNWTELSNESISVVVCAL